VVLVIGRKRVEDDRPPTKSHAGRLMGYACHCAAVSLCHCVTVSLCHCVSPLSRHHSVALCGGNPALGASCIAPGTGYST